MKRGIISTRFVPSRGSITKRKGRIKALGCERCIDEARDNLYKIRSLEGFHHEEEGKDKGVGLREKAKVVAELLNDRSSLREERDKCRQLRDKFVGISAGYGGEQRTFRDGGGRFEG